MSVQPKMKLSDLQLKPVDQVDWKTLDEFYYQDAPRQLSHVIDLVQIIRGYNLMDKLDNPVVMDYVTRLSQDAVVMKNEIDAMSAEYEINKTKYQNNYDENAHMYSLQVAYSMTDWLDKFENTVGVCFNDLIDYIKSNLSAESELVLNLNKIGK